jgi:hypothetical protein
MGNRQGPAGLAPFCRHTAAARSLGPPEVLAGRGGGREIGAEAGRSGRRRGNRGGGRAVGTKAGGSGWRQVGVRAGAGGSGWRRVGVRAGAGWSGRSSLGQNPYIGGGWL